MTRRSKYAKYLNVVRRKPNKKWKGRSETERMMESRPAVEKRARHQRGER